MKAGLYIHIPFCASRCIYCGFYSTVRPELHDRYVDALCREMLLLRDRMADDPISLSTIYLGVARPRNCRRPTSTSSSLIYIRCSPWIPMRRSPWSATPTTYGATCSATCR